MWREIKGLLWKDFILEWRLRYSFGGILLYLGATVFLVYISLIEMEATVWITLFWIIMLFTAVSAVAKSFLQENRGRLLYYYSIAHPRSVIISKIIYNISVMVVLGVVGMALYMLMNKNPLHQTVFFFLVLFLGNISFALTFTIMSVLAAKANQNVTLMAILSLPFIIPALLLLIKLSQYALLHHIEIFPLKDVLMLLLLDVLMLSLSVILFPYLWRD